MASETESSAESAASGMPNRSSNRLWIKAGLALLFSVAIILFFLYLLGEVALWQVFGIVTLWLFLSTVIGGVGLYFIQQPEKHPGLSTSSSVAESATGPDSSVKLWERNWFRRSGLILSILLFVFGILLGLWAITSFGRIPEPLWQTLGVLAAISLTISVISIHFFQLTDTQLYYLDLLEYEISELNEYNKLLKYLEVEGRLDSSNEIDLKETRSRVDTGIKQLEQAKYAVYREDFISFLSTYYKVNGLRIFIYAHLDAVNTSDGSRRVDWSFDLDLQELPDRHVREEGSIEVPQSDESKTRLWNLTRWLWSTSRSLPEAERNEIDDYLLGPDQKLTQSQSPQTLHRALGVVHAWDIQRLSEFMTIKRGLRLLVPPLTVLLIVSIAIIVFTETALSALALNTAPDASPGVLDSPWFTIPIVLAGILGSIFSRALFMHDASSSITSYRSIPDPRVLRETIVMSMLVGGISALILYILLLSSIGNAIFADALRQDPLSILFIAFLGGYSEKFVRQALDKAEGKIGQNDEEGPNTPNGRVPSEKRSGES